MPVRRRLPLDGKIALILGGSGKIGREIAITFAKAGVCVVVAGKTESNVETAVAPLRKLNAGSEGISADVTTPKGLRQVIDHSIGRHKRIDILVNAQGATVRCASEHLSRKAFSAAMSLNLTSVTFSCVEVGREMLAQGSGAIINIASISAHRGFQGSLLSTIAKHGVLGLTRTLEHFPFIHGHSRQRRSNSDTGWA
jgi:NAD(P)-dependent dehydrogenase (short-subunit alcohol dehydrogenase family)